MKFSFIYLCSLLLLIISVNGNEEGGIWGTSVVKKEERRVFSWSENGAVSGVNVRVNGTSMYHLQFITMDPHSLFLPVLLHSDMLFYVQSGSGNLSYFDEDEGKKISLDLQMGDVYALKYGSVFFIQSNLANEYPQKLQICSIFATSNPEIQGPSTGPYSSIHQMLLGFDQSTLRAAFKVPDEVIEELKRGTQQPLIVQGLPKSTKTVLEAEANLISSLLIRKYNMFDIISNKKNKKDKKNKLFNFLRDDRDFENSNGWSTAVTSKKLKVLKHSNMGIFMVNLTKGSMMGPHWNPRATEIGIVVQGQGVVRMVCTNPNECQSKSFRVKEGDVFVVPRFHPMAQMSFSNDTFVFVGFSTWSGKNHPQYLAGKSSVLQTLAKDILAMSFNVPNTTIDKLLANQQESIILECAFCAELEEMKIEEEEGKEKEEDWKREEEEKKREEEEMRKKEEEETWKREQEEKQKEEMRKWEEAEEARRQEEEKRRRQEAEQAAEAARKREEAEEEARREEEEEARRWEEEKRKREEEEEQEAMREREAEAEARKEREAEEERKEREAEEARRQEEEKKRREEETEEEARKREEAEAAMRGAQAEAEVRRKKEEEEAKSREAEAARRQEEEKRREQEAEQAAAEREKEAEAAAKREEEAEEEKRRKEGEEEAARWEEEARRQAEAAKSEKAEAEAKRWQEEEEARRQEEWRKGQGGEPQTPGGGGGGEEAARKEEEAARQQEEERQGGGKMLI